MPITLTSSDNKSFTVDRKAISHAGTIENLIMSMGLDDADVPMPIPLPKVTGDVLGKVVEWLEQHKNDTVYVEQDENAEKRTDDIKRWDKEFLAKYDSSDVLELLLAANYLDIKLLLVNCLKFTAHTIKNKSRDELREIFHIENDFTAEEEEQIEKENKWVEN